MGFRSEATHHLGCRNSSGGFTLIEVIIVLAIIGLLASVLTPTVVRYVQSSKLRRATKDVGLIGAAIAAFYNDLGDWPVWQVGTARQSGDAKAALLYGPGTLPGQSGVPSGDTGDTLVNQLGVNNPAYPTNVADPTLPYAWRGPYLEQFRADPWGHAYLVNVKFLWPQNEQGNKPVYALSSGPNRVVDTDFEQAGPNMIVGGDDIVYRIK
ncbi:MAG TPA: prepilin-type N-terminal cleavage/methylation domain-containing protein [Candidatus Brocadiales bacterium]|nr:prepilin-type N-terminal cleavage/methylation domain-containing protein [Candidatus Brocadiales bacterium]